MSAHDRHTLHTDIPHTRFSVTICFSEVSNLKWSSWNIYINWYQTNISSSRDYLPDHCGLITKSESMGSHRDYFFRLQIAEIGTNNGKWDWSDKTFQSNFSVACEWTCTRKGHTSINISKIISKNSLCDELC